MTLSRREFLAATIGAAAAASCRRSPRPPRFAGRLLGPSFEAGHRLRERSPRGPAPTERIPVVIIGGGLSGLSAAWRFARAKFDDYALLELEDQPGGTSAHGNGVPWGAHYVPVPTADNRSLVALLQEVGAVVGVGDDGEVICAEDVLCRAPQERLFYRGRWYDGLYPRAGASPTDLHELDAFHAAMAAFAHARDGSGRPAFSIPVPRSSDDSQFTALDRLTMAEWLHQQGWHSSRLHWYVDYACRDDYGLRVEQTSAWAGIHYYAARLAGGDRTAELLTWPEGNGRIVDHLARVAGSRLKTGALVTSLVPREDGVEVHAIDRATGAPRSLLAQQVVFALPKFLASRVIEPWRDSPPAHLAAFTYGSWIVANLTLSDRPKSKGFPSAWDNVLYDSDSLGYVVATHQTGRDHGPTTWTWYLPLCGANPLVIREELLAAPWSRWADAVMADLSRAHVDLESYVTNLDVWRWGHAMVRPVPGLLWGGARAQAAEPFGRIHFASTDLSGVALLEEAHHHGVHAAEAVLQARKVAFESML